MGFAETVLGRWLFRGVPSARAGSDILGAVEIELVEAARGTSRHIEVTRQRHCAECGGSGWHKDSIRPQCIECGGRGQIITLRRFLPLAVTCPLCSGQEPAITNPCPACRGMGRTPEVAVLAVDIPPGVDSGMWLQLRNQGDAGDPGAPRGNLRIQVRIKKQLVFDRRGNDLYCQVAVTDAELTGQTEIQVPTLDGTCAVRIKRGMQSGDSLRIKGQGMPEIGGVVRGDIVVEVVVKAGLNEL
jgi:molecular chaperone DnaJ